MSAKTSKSKIKGVIATVAAATMTVGALPASAFAAEIPEEVIITNNEPTKEESDIIPTSTIDVVESVETSNKGEKSTEDSADKDEIFSDNSSNEGAGDNNSESNADDGNRIENIADDPNALCGNEKKVEEMSQTGDETPLFVGGGIAALLAGTLLLLKRRRDR